MLTDLADEKPMNRLIVGDVGFGKQKWQCALPFEWWQEGHQVALLCPTTILAIQHHRTFVERCIDFGIRVALISRMQTAGTKKKLFKMQAGEIDILIGTHAIFSKDLRFNRLGLVIVDEEHRFGVKHKEALQRLSQLNPEGPTEYMAMSATPIPRTLHLAMSGLREVSVIATPPPGRISIQTRFLRFNIKEIAKQIRFELQREESSILCTQCGKRTDWYCHDATRTLAQCSNRSCVWTTYQKSTLRESCSIFGKAKHMFWYVQPSLKTVSIYPT